MAATISYGYRSVMGKTAIDPDPKSDNHPYSAEFFAERHGLTLQAARVILYSNGPSRTMCDAAARAFLQVLAVRKTGSLRLPLDVS